MNRTLLSLVYLAGLVACTNETDRSQSDSLLIERYNPDTVLDPGGSFSQAVSVMGGELLFISGQVALDRDFQLVGERDFELQATRAFENLKLILESRGLSLDNLVRLDVFVVGLDDGTRQSYLDVQRRFLDSDHVPANSLIGVETLARSDLLIEITAIAAAERT